MFKVEVAPKDLSPMELVRVSSLFLPPPPALVMKGSFSVESAAEADALIEALKASRVAAWGPRPNVSGPRYTRVEEEA